MRDRHADQGVAWRDKQLTKGRGVNSGGMFRKSLLHLKIYDSTHHLVGSIGAGGLEEKKGQGWLATVSQKKLSRRAWGYGVEKYVIGGGWETSR